jgi:hypothetical protein
MNTDEKIKEIDNILMFLKIQLNASYGTFKITDTKSVYQRIIQLKTKRSRLLKIKKLRDEI